MASISTALFDLVRTMTPNEKGYFRRRLQTHKSRSNLAELFDFIDEVEEVDDKLIKEHFKGENLAKNLSRSKNSLYEAVLSSLRSYHANAFVRDQLRQMLSEIEILFARGLYDQAYHRIKLAKNKAEKYACHLMLVDLLLWEIRIVYYILPVNKLTDTIESIQQQLDDVNSVLADLIPYYQLNTTTNLQMYTGGFNESELVNNQQDRYVTLAQHPLLLEKAKPLSVEGEYLRLVVNATIAAALKDFEKVEYYLCRSIECIEENFYLLNKFPQRYLISLNNLGVVYLQEGRFEEAGMIAEKISPEDYQHEGYRVRALQIKMNLLMDIMIQGRNLARFDFLYPEFEHHWEKYRERFDPHFRKSFAFNLFLFNFISGRLTEANQFIQCVLNEFSFDLRPQLSFAAKLGEICLYFDQGKWDLVQSKSRALARNTKLHDPVWRQVSNQFLKVLRNKGDEKLAFEKMMEVVSSSSCDDFTASLQHFDFMLWVESKITEKPFSEVFEM